MPNNNWDTSLYDQKHAFVFEYGKGLIPLLQPQPGELILDLGCGTGHLTHAIAESGAHVIGIDSSASMIETAQSTYPHLEFLVADARDFSFASPFDAIFSNATLHWIIEAEQVARCIAASLKPWRQIRRRIWREGLCCNDYDCRSAIFPRTDAQRGRLRMVFSFHW